MTITDEDARVLREAASEADALGCLAPAQLTLIERHDWFRLLAPRSLGAMELVCRTRMSSTSSLRRQRTRACSTAFPSAHWPA